MDSYFKAKGVPEGFCDNNNTLSVIEKNDIVLSAHTIASVIKYPERLYPYQKEKYTALLQKELDIDRAHFSSLQISSRRGAVRNFKLKKQTRTIACEIMDIADRKTYITSDLSDFICLGNSIPANDVKALAENVDLKCRFSHLAPLIFVLQSNDKKVVNNYFNNLKNEFNMNYKLTENGVEVINKDLEDFREFLWKLEFQYYISPLRKEEFHLNNMKSFTAFIDKVVIDGFSPSRTYTKAIASATNPIETLRAQRDMIAEATDWYVTKMQGTENGSLSY
jgi:dGTP triphosphohydrolase